jgi:hypothetical protein
MKLILAFVIAATPALSQEMLVIEFQNSSTRSVDIMGVFPVDAAGNSVEDNIGSFQGLAPGKTASVELASFKCEIVEIGARFSDGEEVYGRTDLCKNHIIILHD